MKTVKLMNEFLHGPIWIIDDEGWITDDLPLVNDDPVLKELNERAMEMYDNYYEFDSHDVACWFNHEQEKADKDIMLDIINKIKARLDEINDGSFVVEDYVTEHLKNL
ncbi:MAG: RNA helicase [Abditibacteriota bacterium]|nr:RNA helicase [Abditibacteriota bacterium]MBP5094154.1 RNA helicase [Abditibacteriota bacterium]MBP5737855.1 RNA helicase [Abditibacteriota bacterium]